MIMKQDEGFLYNVFDKIINFLFKCTFFEILKKLCKIEKIRTMADIYVCIMLSLSIVTAIISGYIYKSIWILTVIFCCVIYRIYEITVTLIFNFFTSKQTKKQPLEIRVLSIKRCIFIFLLNVVEIANHFVALYFSFARLSKIDLTASYISMLKSSAYAFITYNTDAIIEISVNLSGLSFVQSMLGVFYTLILLTMLISNAPKIESINKN